MATITSTREGILERYRQARVTGRRLNTVLTKQLTKDLLDEGGKRLGMLRNGVLIFGTMDESCVLMDYCIYDCRRDGRNAIRRHLETNRSADPEEIAHLRQMLKAWYTLVSVQAVRPGLGVEVIDILRGERLMLVDEGFSRTAIPGVALATRLIPYPDFAMTSGAPLPLDGNSLIRIRARLEAGFGGVTALEQLSDEQKSDLSATIIRCALVAEASSHVRYEDAGLPYSAGRRFEGPRQHRNANCACGSGRKYKNCCGRP